MQATKCESAVQVKCQGWEYEFETPWLANSI